jgi:hypothetical protein
MKELEFYPNNRNLLETYRYLSKSLLKLQIEPSLNNILFYDYVLDEIFSLKESISKNDSYYSFMPYSLNEKEMEEGYKTGNKLNKELKPLIELKILLEKLPESEPSIVEFQNKNIISIESDYIVCNLITFKDNWVSYLKRHYDNIYKLDRFNLLTSRIEGTLGIFKDRTHIKKIIRDKMRNNPHLHDKLIENIRSKIKSDYDPSIHDGIKILKNALKRIVVSTDLST